MILEANDLHPRGVLVTHQSIKNFVFVNPITHLRFVRYLSAPFLVDIPERSVKSKPLIKPKV